MKKTAWLLASVFVLAGSAFAIPTRTGGQNGLVVGSETDEINSGFTIGAGDVLVKGALYMTTPKQSVPIVLLAPAAASNTAFKNTSISTQTLVNASTTFLLANADYTDIITPRNLVIISSMAAGGAYVGTAVVVGKNQLGETTSETISVSTGAANSTGNIAWSTITSITIVTTSINNTATSIQVGSGVKMGLPTDVPALADVIKVIENGALSTTYTYSLTYDTITFAAAPNGTINYQVWLRTRKK